MERLRGHAVRSEQVRVGERTYDLLVPASVEQLLDDPAVEAQFEQDEYMPYWAMLWPAALMLAEEVSKWGVADAQLEVLEIGAGLGLVGLVAAEQGHSVTITDYDEDALAFVRASAERKGIPVPRTCHVDWRKQDEELRADRILAADVLYEARNLKAVANFVSHHLSDNGMALISDPCRRTADTFALTARDAGLAVTERATGCTPPGRATPVEGRIFEVVHL